MHLGPKCSRARATAARVRRHPPVWRDSQTVGCKRWSWSFLIGPIFRRATYKNIGFMNLLVAPRYPELYRLRLYSPQAAPIQSFAPMTRRRHTPTALDNPT